MTKTIFMSNSVIREGHYEIEFTPLGLFLTKIGIAELPCIDHSRCVYLYPGQYIEGSSFTDITVKSTNYKSEDEWIDGFGYTLPEGFSIDTEKLKPTHVEYKEKETTHTCKFIPYHGLIDFYEYCGDCGKRK